MHSLSKRFQRPTGPPTTRSNKLNTHVGYGWCQIISNSKAINKYACVSPDAAHARPPQTPLFMSVAVGRRLRVAHRPAHYTDPPQPAVTPPHTTPHNKNRPLQTPVRPGLPRQRLISLLGNGASRRSCNMQRASAVDAGRAARVKLLRIGETRNRVVATVTSGDSVASRTGEAGLCLIVFW